MSRILVVEDEGIIAKDLQRSLQSLGYDVPEPLSRGEAAVEAAERLKPDLVLMDIHLAGPMDGTEAAQFITESTDTAIVFLTAYADEETVQRAQLAMPYGYLVKPFDDETLRTTVATALHKRTANQEDQQRLRTQEKALDHMDEGVLLADAEGNVTYANPSAKEMLGGAIEAFMHDMWSSIQDASGKPVQADHAGRSMSVSSHPVEGQTVVVLSSKHQQHARAAARAMDAFRQRARDLI